MRVAETRISPPELQYLYCNESLLMSRTGTDITGGFEEMGSKNEPIYFSKTGNKI